MTQQSWGIKSVRVLIKASVLPTQTIHHFSMATVTAFTLFSVCATTQSSITAEKPFPKMEQGGSRVRHPQSSCNYFCEPRLPHLWPCAYHSSQHGHENCKRTHCISTYGHSASHVASLPALRAPHFLFPPNPTSRPEGHWNFHLG